MNRHSVLAVRLPAARAAFRQAEQNCPHWDYESHDGDYDCCHDLRDALREYRAAKKVAEKA